VNQKLTSQVIQLTELHNAMKKVKCN